MRSECAFNVHSVPSTDTALDRRTSLEIRRNTAILIIITVGRDMNTS